MRAHTPPLPPRGPHCPAPVLLEALSAGEPATPEVEAHLPTCADCRTYVEALARGQQDFLAARPPERFLTQLERREQAARARRPSLWRLFLPLATFATAALVLVLVRRPEQDATIPGLLIKGSDGGLVVSALSPGQANPRLLGPDSPVKAGDTLRFAFASERPGHLLVLEKDGTGRVSVFHPFESERSAPLAAGSRDFLPGSVELDAAPGPEWLVAIFAPGPLEAAPLRAQLEAGPAGETPQVSCEGCSVSVLRLQKEK